MVEIRFREHYEITDLAGLSVAEARQQFGNEFGIPEKAGAKLNGKKVKGSLEAETCLSDDDKLSFTTTRSRGALIAVGSLLLALAITGGVFAYGWINATTTMLATAASADFAAVTPDATEPVPDWTPYGFFKGTIGTGTLFNVDTSVSTYTGDLVATVYLANADELVKCYRVMALKIVVMESDNTTYVDINGDTIQDDNDYSLLTLGNAAVDLFIDQGGGSDNYSVRVKSGFYITHIWKAGNWGSSYEDPVLFCEVAQR